MPRQASTSWPPVVGPAGESTEGFGVHQDRVNRRRRRWGRTSSHRSARPHGIGAGPVIGTANTRHATSASTEPVGHVPRVGSYRVKTHRRDPVRTFVWAVIGATSECYDYRVTSALPLQRGRQEGSALGTAGPSVASGTVTSSPLHSALRARSPAATATTTPTSASNGHRRRDGDLIQSASCSEHED